MMLIEAWNLATYNGDRCQISFSELLDLTVGEIVALFNSNEKISKQIEMEKEKIKAKNSR